MTFVRFVVVTGVSGAGKSQAMKSFEDLGFYCLDNLPPALTLELVSLARQAGIERLALALDVRSRGPFGEAHDVLDELTKRGVAYELLFLDANDETIMRRYSETRRRHPLEHAAPLTEAIALERRELAPFRERAAHVWDTSGMTLGALKAGIVSAYGARPGDRTLHAFVVAFGFKFGVPRDADLVFDVRFLTNPNYVPELKALCGADPPVVEFLEALPETRVFLDHLFGMIDFLLPLYIEEGKSRLTVAIGCTGGRHRSVYIAERLAAHLRQRETLPVTVEHRELTPA